MNSWVVVGEHGEEALVEGWHERERDGRNGIPYRAANGTGLLRLGREKGANSLNLILSGPYGLKKSALKGRAEIGERSFPIQLESDLWVLRVVDISDVGGDVLEVRLILDHPVVPDHILYNGDARRLGWFLSAAWQE